MAPMMIPIRITDDQFIAVFGPIQNHLRPDASWDGCMFSPFGDELAYINKLMKTEPNRIWTILETPMGLVTVNGYRVMDRFGYLITSVQGPDSFLIEMHDPDELELNQNNEKGTN